MSMKIEGTDNCGIATLMQLDYANRLELQSTLEYYLDVIEGNAATMIVATTIPSQKQAIALFKQMEFDRMYSFRNNNTGNIVTYWVIPLENLKEKLLKTTNYRTSEYTPL